MRKAIVIKKDVRIDGTRIMLEKGDRIIYNEDALEVLYAPIDAGKLDSFMKCMGFKEIEFNALDKVDCLNAGKEYRSGDKALFVEDSTAPKLAYFPDVLVKDVFTLAEFGDVVKISFTNGNLAVCAKK